MVFETIFQAERTICVDGKILQFLSGKTALVDDAHEKKVLQVEYTPASIHNGLSELAIDCILPPSVLIAYKNMNLAMIRDTPKTENGKIKARYNLLDADFLYS